MRRDLEALQAQHFDIAIIGGGMHGAWIALRAARAGYRVALIEQRDFGAGTSANSLKILHGGLRYLQHLDFGRMRSSIRARREFARVSPHLVQPLPCVMPLQPMGVRSPWILGPALLANDVISFDRNQGVARNARLPYGRLMGSEACGRTIAPLANVDALAGAMWWDALALDASRLVLEAVLAASRAGATIANRLRAQSLMLHDRTVSGLVVTDSLSSRSFEIKASVVIDATGPWAGQLSKMHGLPIEFLPPAWLGGLNVVLKRSLGIGQAIAMSSVSKSADRSAVIQRTTRELFFVPWRDVTMVGTDYHAVSDVESGSAGPPSGAVEKFIEEIAKVAPRAKLSLDDVAMVHWGLLPTDSVDAAFPRKSPILAGGVDETGAQNLIVVIAEKLTSAPTLSEQVLAKAIEQLSGKNTAALPVRVADENLESIEKVPVIDHRDDFHARLMARYGDQWPMVAGLANRHPELRERVLPDLEVRAVEIIHALRHEMALDLEDLLLRRLALGDKGNPGLDVIRHVAEIAAAELGWGGDVVEQAIVELEASFFKWNFQRQIA